MCSSSVVARIWARVDKPFENLLCFCDTCGFVTNINVTNSYVARPLLHIYEHVWTSNFESPSCFCDTYICITYEFVTFTCVTNSYDTNMCIIYVTNSYDTNICVTKTQGSHSKTPCVETISQSLSIFIIFFAYSSLSLSTYICPKKTGEPLRCHFLVPFFCGFCRFVLVLFLFFHLLLN